MTIRSLLCLSLGLLLPSVGEAQPAKPFRYEAGKHAKGELKYVDGIPVLILQGTPEEMGEQAGTLAVRQAKAMYNFPLDYFRSETANEIRRKNPKISDKELKQAVDIAERTLWPMVLKKAASLEKNFPKSQLDELNAIIKSSQMDRQLLLSTNGMFDLGHITPEQLLLGCSSLIIPPKQSATEGVLFGRNLDFYHFGYLHHYSLLIVYRSDEPRKKHSFASAGFPGFVGSFTGMNDAGLTIASHEVQEPNTTTRFNPKGVPFAMAYRRILEECSTVADALALLDRIERASVTSLVIADSEGGAVIEVTPDSLAIRRFKDKAGVCTNHFSAMKTPNLKEQFDTFKRFDILTKSAEVKKNGLAVADVHKGLHDARLLDNDKVDMTIQTFVFEPATRKVHLSFGNGKLPATAEKLSTLDLNKLWVK